MNRRSGWPFVVMAGLLMIATPAASVPAGAVVGQAEGSRLERARAEWETLNRLVMRIETNDMLAIERDGRLMPVSPEDFAAHLTYRMLAEGMTSEEAVAYVAEARAQTREIVGSMRDQMFKLNLEIRALTGEAGDPDDPGELEPSAVLTGEWVLELQSPPQSGTLAIRDLQIGGREFKATVRIGRLHLEADGMVFRSGSTLWVAIRGRARDLQYTIQATYVHPSRLQGVLQLSRVDGSGEAIDRRDLVARRPE